MSNQRAYEAVYAYIDSIGGYLPPDEVHRNAMIWRAVEAALEADKPTALRRAHDAFHLGLRLTEEPNGTFHPSFWEEPETHLHHMDTYVGGNSSTKPEEDQ
ncbi:hypothetical protein [Nocardiopsis sp. CA-288880]|uniref:hypothetical protein n=1 Tax=Nocardiopsis sp. CA-288880 TaxID=3239995 RepID=UPI003D953656